MQVYHAEVPTEKAKPEKQSKTSKTDWKTCPLPGYKYQQFSHIYFAALAPTGYKIKVCADIGSPMSMISTDFLQHYFPATQGLLMEKPVSIGGIDDGTHKISHFFNIDLEVPTLAVGSTIHLMGEVHVVLTLDCGLLIRLNILKWHGVILNLCLDIMTVGNSKVKLLTNAHQKRKCIPVYATVSDPITI